jgi:23S rRNA (cytidine1920-2'-O)/16S rRNA (cytidine1409-2'-O)-methyltransferase
VRRRLDVELVRRGISQSRTEAGLAIRSGTVTVSGRPVVKASTMVADDEPIAMSEPARRFVSRGGEKLDAALDRFGVDVAGASALDAGASTGGFTDCLLRRGAARVVAVDVGYGQLDWRLRQDPRVHVLERTNVRDLEPSAVPFEPNVVTADLSFISLSLVLPALARVAAPNATFVLLVKPQFEAGRDRVDGGVVREPGTWTDVLRRVVDAVARVGLDPAAVMASPILGPAGNAEFPLLATRGAAPAPAEPGAVDRMVEGAVREAIGLVERVG